ncbi:MAG: hypothetical protein ACYSOH_07460 [Planctomycetota bacterium]|jgi:hypothetical protein
MFQWISIIGFSVVFAGLFLHHLIFPCGYKPRFTAGSLIRKKVHLLTLLLPEQKLNWPTKFRKLVFVLGLFSFCVLLLTGFGPVLFGHKLQDYWLMIHATFAPVFIACAAMVVLLGAGEYAFNRKDADAVAHRCCGGDTRGCWLTDSGVGAKAGFWLLAILSLPVTLTMVLSMLPLFGTDGQELLFHLHRWSGLFFALTAIVELYILARMRLLEDIHGRRDEPKT